MAAKNDVTGDRIVSRNSNEKYAKGWKRIFGKKKNKTRVSSHQRVSASEASG